MRTVNLLMNIVFVVLLCSPIPVSALTLDVIVGTNDIVDGAVTTPKIADSAVTTAKIADGAITATKLAPGIVIPVGYAGMKVVHKGQADGVNTFNSVTAALNAITNASATNPYLVKVMPGVYDLGTASVQMKSYVDLEGSGPDNTIITSSNNNVDGSTCTVGTVLMANNSSIRHIKIVNRAPELNGDYTTVAALVFNNVRAKAEGISVLTGSDTAVGGQNDGICTYGASAHAILNNVYIETHNLSGQSNAIITMGGKLTLTNSKLVSFNEGKINIINDNSETPSSVTVINSTLEGNSPNVTGIFTGANNVSIINSTITLNVGGSGYANVFYATGELSMANSRIISESPTVTYNAGGNIRIANSLLPGSDNLQLPNVKLVNNYDENFDPIPNQ